ncbi:hypothetical protein MKX08_008415 [Trichoderma sp. CBMAI-0020]|nr:hypothetical protein MKX08_008415 [Trichoderma sp. CBMAI-0020]
MSSTRLCDDADEDMAVVARPTPTSSKSGEASTTHNRCGDRSDPIPLWQSRPRASTARLGGDESGYGAQRKWQVGPGSVSQREGKREKREAGSGGGNNERWMRCQPGARGPGKGQKQAPPASSGSKF